MRLALGAEQTTNSVMWEKERNAGRSNYKKSNTPKVECQFEQDNPCSAFATHSFAGLSTSTADMVEQVLAYTKVFVHILRVNKLYSIYSALFILLLLFHSMKFKLVLREY
jgi:hypothetical protein